MIELEKNIHDSVSVGKIESVNLKNQVSERGLVKYLHEKFENDILYLVFKLNRMLGYRRFSDNKSEFDDKEEIKDIFNVKADL